MRASTLKSSDGVEDPGQAALPGGKADFLQESAFQTARREAFEEIGLPNDDAKLPEPFYMEHICELPTYLARTELGVRPCVAFLHPKEEAVNSDVNAEEALMPRLDAKEVAAVFSAPFHNFLKERDEILQEGDEGSVNNPSGWYEGSWTEWHEAPWRMHHFYVPVTGHPVTKPKSKSKRRKDIIEKPGVVREPGQLTRYRVFGMTARILVDAARLAHAEDPEFEHNSHFGDEDMIKRLRKTGKMSAKRSASDELKTEDLVKAAKI
ncbi:MAG: hypothetical protein M1819_002538 [Sarea resinae]|nr:MAG: hypothetical protein M1819_002538 [Sarea resinae]